MKWIVDDRDGSKVTCSECGREALSLLQREYGQAETRKAGGRIEIEKEQHPRFRWYTALYDVCYI